MLLTQIEIELGRLPEAAAAARSFVAQSTTDATYTAFGAKLFTRIASAWRAGTAADREVRADELEASALTALRAAFDLDSRKALRDRVAGDGGYAPLRRHAAFQDLLGTPGR